MSTKSTFEVTVRILRAAALPTLGSPAPRFGSSYDEARQFVRKSIVCGIAEAFADEYAQNNPRFDRERFLVACGVIG